MGTRYVNFISEGDEQDEVQNAFGPNLDRLMNVKNQFDPEICFARTSIWRLGESSPPVPGIA